jgi:hypothetical protein
MPSTLVVPSNQRQRFYGLLCRSIYGYPEAPIEIRNKMMQVKIVRFKQGITYLFNVAAVTLEDPLSVVLRFVKEHFGSVSVNCLLTDR